ncbi:hypothetical protein CC80DRAFT_405738 [Byssothecium circinans]|uniref:Altered inheritance of mitochondria protein 6 n=1 Tax=Byssothecium circinans TaxID=147558 RepID=A0A6A5U503_9PLEO|nr:hypothetical protein CC80DRAFT_405738 [Byssothecium circinans]
MPTLKPFSRRYRDNNVGNVEDQSYNISASDEESIAQTKPRWYETKRGRRWADAVGIEGFRSRGSKEDNPDRRAIRRRRCKFIWIVFGVAAFFGAVAAVTYVSLVAALIRRLNPPQVNNGLKHIVDTWKEPDSNGAFKYEWRDDFSRDIVPKSCHSHNDYWRSVPLYQALAAGCISFEADVWLNDDKELLVSHSWKSTKKERTLRSLYLDPLANIFTNRNVSVASTERRETGMFDADPSMSTVLLIDFKNDGQKIWPVLREQLQPLHDKGWLTYYNGTTLINGALTIVGTGNTPFDLVKQNNTNRFIFYDAPLNDISNPTYNSSNSYYASISMSDAIGTIWLNQLNTGQVDTIKRQIKAADEKGLKSRYWSTPSWPISFRNRVWFTLTDNDVGMLNVDDLVSATRWNWNWCVIAGLTLCGHS